MDAELVHALDQVDLQFEGWIADSWRLQPVTKGFVVKLKGSSRPKTAVGLVPVVDEVRYARHV